MNLFEGLGPIIIYTIVLLLWTCKHIIVCRSYTITAFILSMYTITAISAVLFYYLYSSRVGYVNITLFLTSFEFVSNIAIPNIIEKIQVDIYIPVIPPIAYIKYIITSYN